MYEINQSFPVLIVHLRPFDKKRVPEVERIPVAYSLPNLLQETVAVLESETVFPFDLGKFGKCEKYGFVEKIPPETGSQIEDIHLHGREQDCPERNKLAVSGSRHDTVLRGKIHFSFPFCMPDSPMIREMVLSEFSAEGQNSGIRRNQLQKNPLMGRDGIDEEIDGLKDIRFPRTVRSCENILIPPGK